MVPLATWQEEPRNRPSPLPRHTRTESSAVAKNSAVTAAFLSARKTATHPASTRRRTCCAPHGPMPICLFIAAPRTPPPRDNWKLKNTTARPGRWSQLPRNATGSTLHLRLNLGVAAICRAFGRKCLLSKPSTKSFSIPGIQLCTFWERASHSRPPGALRQHALGSLWSFCKVWHGPDLSHTCCTFCSSAQDEHVALF